MSHVTQLSLLRPGGENATLLLQIMRQTLNVRLTETPLMTLREISVLHKIQYRLAFLSHVSGPSPRTLMLSESPATHNILYGDNSVAAQHARFLLEGGTLGIAPL